MASKYTNAFKAIIEKTEKEEEAKTPTSSVVPSSNGSSVRDRLAKMIRAADVRSNEAYIKNISQNRSAYERYQQRLAEFENFVNNRTQDVIQADIDAAKSEKAKSKADGPILVKAFEAITGQRDEKKAQAEEYDTLIAKYEDELARRKAYDYAKLSEMEDFAEKSKYSPNDDDFYGYINRDPEATESYISTETMEVPGLFREYFGMSDPQAETMTEDEIATYNYIYATEGKEAAKEYFEFIISDLNARYREAKDTEREAYAQENPVEASIGSVVANVGSVLTSPAILLQQAAYGEIDENDPIYGTTHTKKAYRNAVSSKIEESWGPVGSYAYGIGMSMADFLTSLGVRVASGGIVPAELILSSSATVDTTLDALERGVSSDRAFLMGVAAGLIEAATEKWSIETLLKNYSKKGIMQFILSNIASEASEEAISEIANTITDAILAEDQSYWIEAINKYKLKGYDDSQAIARALLQELGDVVLAALGGAISGGVMAGGRVAIDAGTNAIQNAGDAAAARDNAYRGQNTIREILNSDKYKDIRNEQKKYTVLPTAVDEEIKAARDRGEVFDIGYEKPYTGVADTLDDIELQKKIDAAETVTEKTGIRHGASEQDISDALEISRALGVEVEFFTQSSKETGTVLDGFYNTDNGHIYVNVNAAKALETVISHEITHSFEGTDAYNELRELVEKELKKRGDSIEAAAKRLSNIYDKSGRGQDMQANEADVVANFVEKYVLGTKQSIHNVVSAKPNFGRRALALLNRLLAKMRRGSSAYVTVNQIQEWFNDAVTSEAQDAPTADGVEDAATANEENATASETRENTENEEVIAGEETPVTEAQERSQEREKKEKASAKAEADESTSDRGSGATGDTQTLIIDEAEDWMRDVKKAYDAGELTEEQLAQAESIYDEWYETGVSPDISSHGFEEGTIPRFSRKLLTGKRRVKHSISYTTDNRPVAVIEEDILAGVEPSEWRTKAKTILAERFPDGVAVNGATIKVNRTTRREFTKSDYSERLRKKNTEAFADKMRLASSIDDVVIASTDWIRDGKLTHDRSDNFIDFSHGTVLLMVGENKYSADVVVGYTMENDAVLYDVVKITPDSFEIKKEGITGHQTTENTSASDISDSSTSTIPRSVSYVNPENEDVTNLQYSVSEIVDENGKSFGRGVILDSTLLENLTPDERVEMVKLRINELGGKPFTAYDGNGNAVEVTIADSSKRFENKNGKKVPVNKDLTTKYIRNETKQEAVVLADELIMTASYYGSESPRYSHDWLDDRGQNDWEYWTTYIQDKNNTIWEATLNVANTANGEKILYDISPIKKVGQSVKSDTIPTDNTIPRSVSYVNPESEDVTNLQYSVSERETASDESRETSDTYKDLPEKAKSYLRKVEDRIGRAFDKALELDLAGEEGDYKTEEYKAFLKETVRPITLEYLETGEISRVTISGIFEKYYKSPNGLAAHMYDQAKMDARGVFENIINEYWNELRNVSRFAEQVKREKAKLSSMEPITREDARKRFATLRQMQNYEREAMRGNLLTDEDMLEVGKLLRGEISLKSLNSAKNNVAGIRAVYEAKRQTIEAERAVEEYRRHVKAQYYAYWDDKLGTMFEWEDKQNGLLYQRETLERNLQDIIPDKELAKEIIRDIISPIHAHEAESTRWKTKLAARVKALDISMKKKGRNTVSESFAVQFWGEASDNTKRLEADPRKNAKIDGKTLKDWQAALDNMWEQNPDLDQAKIKKAAVEFRKIYEEIFEEMNNVLLDNGYPPVAYRQGYFPHFTGEEETVLAKFGRLIGIKTEMMNLPTTINGLTENFKPGKTWFGHAQQRQGIYTTYDAVTGFEQYIIGAANVIFHTEDIQKLRAMSNQIRHNASDAGVRAEINKILNNETIDDEQRESLLADLRQDGRFALSNFVAYIDEYTNKLAGKKSRIDRGIESLLGRKFYLVMSNLESRVAANMIAGNFGSAMTNFIPVNQAAAQLGWDWMLKGLKRTYKNVLDNDRITAASTFLVNRRGYDPITKTFVDKTADFFGKPMTVIDNLASEWIVRAAYARNLSEGLTPNEALYQADLFAASVMADRSKGAVPLIFENKNPILKIFTQFQVEVNNEFSVLLKDIPRRERKRWTDAIAWVLFKYFLGAFLYNELYERIVGRRAALDPVGIVTEAVEDIREGEKFGVALKNAGTNALEQLPFIGGVLGGGRVPIQSAIPDIGTIAGAVNSDWDKKKKSQTIWKEAAKPLTYLVLPFGGGALKKLAEGAKTIYEGGKYIYDAEGRKMLQYPFYNDQGLASWGEGARTILFGSTSTAAGQAWVDRGFGSLGAMQTAVYQSLIESGVDQKTAYNTVVDLSNVESEQKETKSVVVNFSGIKVEMEVPVDSDADIATKAELQRQMLRDSDLPGDGKAAAYFGLLASSNEQILMEKMDDFGADMGVVTDVLMGMKDAGSTPEKIDLLIGADLNDDEKRLIYEDRISESRAEDIIAFAEADMDFDTFLKCNKKYNELYNGEGNASYKATELARWINQNGFNAEEKAVIEEAFKYYSMIPAKAGKYDDFTDAGLDDETAYKLTEALADLTPAEGKTQVTALQKYRAVIDTVASPVYQMDALEEVMTESEFKKTAAAYSYGIEAETYITYLEKLSEYDKDGNGSLTQLEVEDALNALSGTLTWAEKMTLALTGGTPPAGSFNLSNDQLAVLWQLANTGWKAKNNPYSTEIGQAVLDLLGKGEK